MFTKYDKKQVNNHLEKVQLYLQTFRTQTDALQSLWQEIIHVQVLLERIEVEEDSLPQSLVTKKGGRP